MLVLGIETSCDETATAVLDFQSQDGFRILAENISSQTSTHEPYGGVVPELASREHLKALPLLLNLSLSQADVEVGDIDLISVTFGPGLKGCLLTGVEFAKGLAVAASTELTGVNHIEGHVWAPKLNHPELEPPFLALIVSGGHSEIQRVNDLGSYELIARTVDDAAGEAFDKSAALMGFPYPGGPKLAQLADSFEGKSNFKLPKVMREAKGLSFAGLKTAISLLVNQQMEAGTFEERKAELAFAIQDSIVDALIFKLKRALESSPSISTVVVTGGVSANRYLRKKMEELPIERVVFPAQHHCMDNAAMIAYVGAARSKRFGVEGDFTIQPRAPIESSGTQRV